MFTTDYSCIFYLCLPMFTSVFLRLPMFTHVYHCFARAYLCLHMFNTVYSFYLSFTNVNSCLAMLPLFTLQVSKCLHFFTCVYLCLHMFNYMCPSKWKPTLQVKSYWDNWPKRLKKVNFGKNSFIGYSCYISYGIPCDSLTVEILPVVPEIWTLLYRAVCSHFAYTEHKPEIRALY